MTSSKFSLISIVEGDVPLRRRIVPTLEGIKLVTFSIFTTISTPVFCVNDISITFFIPCGYSGCSL